MCKRSFFQVGLAYGYGLQIVDAAADIRELDVGDIDDMESDVPVQEQLRQILIDNAVRVIDLFRDWDDDGDGRVSKKEFRKAMKMLGMY